MLQALVAKPPLGWDRAALWLFAKAEVTGGKAQFDVASQGEALLAKVRALIEATGPEPPGATERSAYSRRWGRMFALLDERVGKDHDTRHAFAASVGVVLPTDKLTGEPTFSGLDEVGMKRITDACEIIPPERWAKPPRAIERDEEDAILAAGAGSLWDDVSP